MEKKEFVLKQSVHLKRLFEQLGKSFILHEVRPQKVTEVYYDTFDWLLYKGNCTLKRRGRSLYLQNSKSSTVVKGDGFNRKKFFAWDLEEGELRDQLQPLSDIRALIEILSIISERKSFSLLNKDRKTVARLFVDSGISLSNRKERKLPPIISVSGLKGYEKPFTKVAQIVKSQNAKELIDSRTRFDYVLKKTGGKPLDYSSKYNLSLDPAVNVHEAVSQICLYLVRAMVRNHDGVIRDIDSEFLHDFRIAIRRTRSLLSQMKKGLPAEQNMYFQNELRWLGSITGPVRDIDVYLLMKDEYKSMVPEELHEGLTYFFEDLESSRKSSLQQMQRGLTSERYDSLVKDWKKFLKNKDKDDEWPLGKELCQKVAAKIIRKRFNRILKDGRAITAASPDEDLHRLRIQGKKLRYLLEFFRSFYSPDDIDFFLKQMKKLQNNLGDFNDLSVQQEMLLEKQKQLVGRSKRSLAVAAAIGGLLAHLNDEHGLVRQEFEETFAEFTSEQNIERFTSILI